MWFNIIQIQISGKEFEEDRNPEEIHRGHLEDWGE